MKFNWKQNIPLLCCLLCCILTVGSVINTSKQISSLEEELSTLRRTVNDRYLYLDGKINDYVQNVDNTVQEATSLLTAGSYNYENVNYKDGTVDVVCSISPKEFSPQDTTATLMVNGKDYSMNLKNTEFLCKITLPLYKDTEISTVTLKTGDTLQNQTLNWNLNPRDVYMAQLYSKFSGSAHGSKAKDSLYSWNMSGDLEVSVEQKGGLTTDIVNIDIVQYVDGEEIERSSLLEKIPDENVQTWGRSDYAVVTSEDPYELVYQLNKEFLCPYGSQTVLCVEMTDQYGLTHRSCFEIINVEPDGKLADRDPVADWYGRKDAVYNEKGELLYGYEP